jgi:sensor domain CHASE-containing protein
MSFKQRIVWLRPQNLSLKRSSSAKAIAQKQALTWYMSSTHKAVHKEKWSVVLYNNECPFNGWAMPLVLLLSI